MPTDMHWNSPSLLPPVDCPILIRHCEMCDAQRVERTTHLADRNGQMEYRCIVTGRLYHGRFEWTYP